MINNHTKESIHANIIVKLDDYKNPDAIEKTISYIYHLGIHNQNPLPIYCYGIPYFPPTYQNLIQSFYEIRSLQANALSQQVWHIFISFQLSLSEVNTSIYNYIDAIAQIFGQSYPVCYAYHNKKDQPHFHFIISSCSYLEEGPVLDRDRLNSYFAKITELSFQYHIEANFIDKE